MPTSTAEIRRRNVFNIIRAIHASDAPTRKWVATETGLSVATVSNVVASLVKRGLITEVAHTRQAVGRPTAELALNGSHGLLLGIDIAETYVHVETFDSALAPISSTELTLDSHRNEASAVTRRVRDAIAQEVSTYPAGAPPLLGVGVSAPGQVDSVGGTSVYAPNWDWRNVPLLALLKDLVDAPLSLDNPLKSVTIAELWSGYGRMVDDFIVLNLGTGVGAGIAFDRQVFRGRTNSAGEWGHSVIVAGGRACRCGSLGCVEAYVGAPGIMQTIRELDPASPLLRGDDQTSTLAELRAAADHQDPAALEVIERTGYYLGIAMGSLINILNPQLVVLGGWVTRILGDRLLTAALAHIGTHSLPTPLAATKFEVQNLAGNPVSLGAASLALEKYLDSTNDVFGFSVTSTPSPPAAASKHAA